jgi:outer membrane lipoprotein-sorting protein
MSRTEIINLVRAVIRATDEVFKKPNMIRGRYNNEVVYIDTDSRMMYNSMGQTVLQFRH